MENKLRLDLNNVKQELKLLIEILKFDNGHTPSSYKSDRSIDWETFLSLAKHHRIYPQIFLKADENQQIQIPSQIINRLKKAYQKNTIKMLHLTHEMESLNSLLLKENVRMLFLKGPVLADDLYGDISRRTSSDIDVLIPIDELDRVHDLLVDCGYVKDDYISTVLSDWKWRHHHVAYFHPEKRVKLEVHWRLNPGPGPEPNFNDLWNRKRVSNITPSPSYYLGREDLLLFLISHGARHGWSRLRWVVDIHQLFQNQSEELDWTLIFKLSKKYYSYQIVGQALLLSANLFGTELNKEMDPLIKSRKAVELSQNTVFYFENMVNLHTEPLPEEVAKYHKRYLFLLKTFRQKTLFILSFLFPYSDDADTLPLPKSLHFLYFPLRPFLWFWRKTKKLHALNRGI
ncbi:nucleotidyltransferase family protein [Bacillus spongiae]|uniref:Nucleotidyltransferase family protein n=1 Tax=Bacillus spongiae TaxID=2683610 RepID=A0ABU8HES9_9BACI